LNFIDLNKYAEHQLKVQIEVFCSNKFISRKALLAIPSNFSGSASVHRIVMRRFRFSPKCSLLE